MTHILITEHNYELIQTHHMSIFPARGKRNTRKKPTTLGRTLTDSLSRKRNRPPKISEVKDACSDDCVIEEVLNSIAIISNPALKEQELPNRHSTLVAYLN